MKHRRTNGTAASISTGTWGSGDANQDVYWIQAATSQSVTVSVRFEVLSGTCTGVRVVLTGGTIGKFHYKHISPASGINNSTWQNWYVWPTSVQGDRWLGRTSSSQPNCPWAGPHLHQSGDVSGPTDIWRRNPTYVDCGGPLYCWSGPAFNVTW
jgi:hypothetical protein